MMAIALGFISSLFNVSSSQDMPFCKLQQLQYLHHGSTKAFFFFHFPAFMLGGTCIMALDLQHLCKCSASRGTSQVNHCLESV